MHDRARAQAWRTTALVLAGGWVVLACGGADDDVPPRAASASASLPVVAWVASTSAGAWAERAAAGGDAASAAAADAGSPCASGPAVALKRSTLQASIEAELDAVVQAASAQPAGTVEAADPFDER